MPENRAFPASSVPAGNPLEPAVATAELQGPDNERDTPAARTEADARTEPSTVAWREEVGASPTGDAAPSVRVAGVSTAVCDHEWSVADWHVCPTVATDDNRHVHYRWSICRKCGAGSVK